MSVYATWALIKDLRDRIEDYDADTVVPRPLGQNPTAQMRHKLVEILEVAPTTIRSDRSNFRDHIDVERTVLLQAFWAIGATDEALDRAEEDAGKWFDGLREHLTLQRGDGWARDRKIRFVEEPVAMARDGGFLFYQLRLVTSIQLTVGQPPTP